MRKKVTLAYITNHQERKTSFKKRKTGFLNKLDALCTLCDVEACCILYTPYETGPVVWPNPEAVHSVLERFKNISLFERMKKTVDQERYNMMRINKFHDKLYKIQKENKRKKLELYMFQVIASKMTLDCFDVRDVADINLVINHWLRNLKFQINKLKGTCGEGKNNVVGGSSSHITTTVAGTVISEAEAEVGVTAMSEIEVAADLEATMEALTPLIPSLDLSMPLEMYNTNNNTTTVYEDNIYSLDYSNEWNNLMINNQNDVVPNYGGAYDDGGSSLLGDGTEWNNQLTSFDVANNNDNGGEDHGNDGDNDDDIDCSSSDDDDTDEEDDDENCEDEGL